MKESTKNTNLKAKRRAKRTRARISGTAERPRMCVNLTNQHIYVQFVDDQSGKTILAVNDSVLGTKQKHLTVDSAKLLGGKAAEQALAKGVNTVIFDRGSHAYHGRVKALAEGAREGGLKF